jgi:hypothetical protein
MKQSNHHFSFTIGVNATPERVWKQLIDVPTWHLWDTELISAQLEGDFKLGANGVFTPKKGPQLKFFISEMVEGQSYIFKTKMPLGWLEIKRTITEENNMTFFTDDIQFTGGLKYLFAAILGGQFRSILPEVMGKFKNRVEN